MKILIESPTWLGDCVMATPAIENLIVHYPNAKITVFGSAVASAIFAHHPQVKNIIIDKSRTAKNRYLWLYQTAKTLEFDTVFSFRRQFSSKFFAYFVRAKTRFYYQRYDKDSKHQVIRYNDFVNHSLGLKTRPDKLKIYLNNSKNHNNQTLGLNPGASYGSAKRWYPTEFAKVASKLSNEYDTIIFGAADEIEFANDIEKLLLEKGVKNYQNLAGKTTIDDLINYIAGLDLFITGDSGPMHVAAALQVPSVAIFGPTKDDETAQWMNKNSVIVKQNLDCQPCMQRICPLKADEHHQCMKNIDTPMVLSALNQMTKDMSN